MTTVGAHLQAFRYAEGVQTTVSRVSEDGDFICYFLEDAIQDGPKVPGQTCIPPGLYRVGITRNSPMSMRYYNRWPDSWYRGLPTLEWAEDGPMWPKFKHLRIHPGRDHTDTLGCPITASDVLHREGDYLAEGSVRAFEKLCHRIYSVVLDDEDECYLTISDHEVRL